MASSFTFGFDYDEGHHVDPNSSDSLHLDVQDEPAMEPEPQLEVPKLHALHDMLLSLPSAIFYSTIAIKPRQDDGALRTIRLPRRDLFDIRAQLMAEDPGVGETDGEKTSSSTSVIAGLLSASDDITPRVYEGGFKTWECAIDLAGYLAGGCQGEKIGRAIEMGGLHVIELGAGTALPTMTLLHLLLANPSPPLSTPFPIRLTLADYNPSVLHLSTIPNILLKHTLHIHDESNHSSTPLAAGPPLSDSHSDLEISPSLLSNFTSDLDRRGIHISAISGAWSSAFADLAVSQRSHPDHHPPPPSTAAPVQTTLVLASETIYSPTSILPFTTTLFALLHAAEAHGGGPARALIAAKKVYFGVGGGVDEFLALVVAKGGTGTVVWESGGIGVGRVILEVRNLLKEKDP